MLFAYGQTVTKEFAYELVGQLRPLLLGSITGSQKKTFEQTWFKELEDIQKEMLWFHGLQPEIQALTTEFEKQRFTLKSIHRFKDREETKNAVKRLRDAFKQELAKYG